MNKVSTLNPEHYQQVRIPGADCQVPVAARALQVRQPLAIARGRQGRGHLYA